MSTPNSTAQTFYIAANIIFDIATGETKNVLMLVNNQNDASIFSSTDAQKYLTFVMARAQKIHWSIQQLTSANALRESLAGPRFVIKGVQYV